MKTDRALLLVGVLLLLLCGCGPRSSKNAASGRGSSNASSEAASGTRGSRTSDEAVLRTRTFPTPQPPSVYDETQERVTWLQMHYWDSFLSTTELWPSDSTTVNGVPEDKFEESFATFVYLTEMTDIPAGRKALDRLFTLTETYQKADSSSTVFARMAETAEKYYYEPNSPYRNEDLYLAYIERLAASDLTPAARRKALEFDIRLCSLNPVGSPAADFRFTDIRGRTRTLYDIKADYTLLFFSNPGCEACKEIIENLNASEKVARLIAEKKLAVVNVYIDEDLDEWRSYQDYYPDSWYNGYDPDFVIRTDLLYSVRAIPSLYMLDSGKRVIMKDATPDNVFAFIDNLE